MRRERLARALAPIPLFALLAAAPAGSPAARSLFGTPAAPATTQASPDQTGSFALTFAERSPLSDLSVVVRRMGWLMEQIKAYKAPLGYRIADESFEAYVPASYDGAEPYGLFVWVNAGDSAHVPDRWLEVFDRHKLIAVSANNSGNRREVWSRMGLAIDAVHNMKARYRIDPGRVYVGGMSGGGRTASHLGIGFPDVFRGGYYVVGVNYYRTIPTESDPRRFWKQYFMKPPKDLFRLTRDRSRHVLLTGDTDANREQTHAYSAAMKSDGFKFVTYIQVPGMGHAIPNAEWFEKGVVALDGPREQVPAALDAEEYKEPTLARGNAGPSTRPAKAGAATKPTVAESTGVERRSDPSADEAARQLRGAKLYLNDGRLYPKARERLKKVADAYPATPAGREAAALLKQIDGK